MTESINAIALGIVQGLTEFLPVSSSGHIEIAQALMGDDQLGEQSMLMTVVLHFATALSTVVVFRQEIHRLWEGVVRSILHQDRLRAAFANRQQHEEIWFCFYVFVSMLPAATVGILLEDQIESLFEGRLVLVGAMLVVTGVLLLLADRAKVTEKPVRLWDAVLIGIAQAIAILPGVSRSGATISASVLLGVDRARAARFSFLMVVPLIFGKMAYDVFKALTSGEQDAAMFQAAQLFPLALGFLAAFVTGCLACTWMIKLVKACQLSYFSYYCFVVAAIVLTIQLW